MAILLFFLAILIQLFTVALVLVLESKRLSACLLILIVVIATAFIHPFSLLLGIPICLLCLTLIVPVLRRDAISVPVYNTLAKSPSYISDAQHTLTDIADTDWEKQLYTGQPNWHGFASYAYPTLTSEEYDFLENEVETLCLMLDDWHINQHEYDLPEKVWKFLKLKGFLGLSIASEFGGRAFSPYAQSRVFSKIASHSLPAAVTCAETNAPGLGYLLMHYGNVEQQRWLPKLVKGSQIGCLAIASTEKHSTSTATNPATETMMSDAVADIGIVGFGYYRNKRMLGIQLSIQKSWVSLAPVATLIAVAFRLYDPDKLIATVYGNQFSNDASNSSENQIKNVDATADGWNLNAGELEDEPATEYGITCALLEATHEGVSFGGRHHPIGAAFMSGTIEAKDIFIPLDAIIGGVQNAGKGLSMLMDVFQQHKGISLPSLGLASSERAYLLAGAHCKIMTPTLQQTQAATPDNQTDNNTGIYNTDTHSKNKTTFPESQEETSDHFIHYADDSATNLHSAVLSKIATDTYRLEAMRHLLSAHLNHGQAATVLASMTQQLTLSVTQSNLTKTMQLMEQHATQQGTKNTLASFYQAFPSLCQLHTHHSPTHPATVFAQASLLCHPYWREEIAILNNADKVVGLKAFDAILHRHLAYTLRLGLKSLFKGLLHPWLVGSIKRYHDRRSIAVDELHKMPKMSAKSVPHFADAFSLPYYRQINRLSTNFGLIADVTLSLFGLHKPQANMLYQRLADIHTHLVSMSAILFYYAHGDGLDSEKLHVRLALDESLYQIQDAFFDFFDNLPKPKTAKLLKHLIFPQGRIYQKPSDTLISAVSDLMVKDDKYNAVRQQIKDYVFYHLNLDDGFGYIEATYQQLLDIEPLWIMFKKQQQQGNLFGLTFEDQVIDAIKQDIINEEEAEILIAYNGMRYETLLTDTFDIILKDTLPRYNIHHPENAVHNITAHGDRIQAQPAIPNIMDALTPSGVSLTAEPDDLYDETHDTYQDAQYETNIHLDDWIEEEPHNMNAVNTVDMDAVDSSFNTTTNRLTSNSIYDSDTEEKMDIMLNGQQMQTALKAGNQNDTSAITLNKEGQIIADGQTTDDYNGNMTDANMLTNNPSQQTTNTQVKDKNQQLTMPFDETKTIKDHLNLNSPVKRKTSQ